MPLPSPRKSVQRVLTLLVSSALALLAAEAVLRAFFPVYLSDQYIRRDGELQFALRENFRGVFRKDYTLSVAINSLGLRNEREVGPKPEGTRRILVVGDSYTFGSGVSNGETYSDFLEKYLNAPEAAGELRNAKCLLRASSPPLPGKEPPSLVRDLFLRSLQDIGQSLAEHGEKAGSLPRAAFAIAYNFSPFQGPVATYSFIRKALSEAAPARPGARFIDMKDAFPWVVEGSSLPPGERLVDCFNRHSDGHWSPIGNAFIAHGLAEGLRPMLPPGGKVEVWNAGVQGWGSLQYAIRIRQLLGAVQPDIVLVMFTTNDLRDNEIFLERPGRIASVALEWGRRYAWQVQAVFADGAVSPWSPEAEFTIGGKDTEKAPPPAALAGKDGVPAPIGPVGSAPVSPRFSWKPVPGAKAYRFKLSGYPPGATDATPILMDRTGNAYYELTPRWRALGRKALTSSQVVRRLFHTYQLWKLSRDQQRIEGG